MLEMEHKVTLESKKFLHSSLLCVFSVFLAD